MDFYNPTFSESEFTERPALIMCLYLSTTASEIIKKSQDKSQSTAAESKRDNLLMSLAHEINTPLTGILAESENLAGELSKHPELQRLAKNNLEQVLRLQLLTDTIVGILSKEKERHSFQEVNVYQPLKEACDLFSSEAIYKGCEILGPEHIGSGNFPEIQMSRFDMEIAFKNIIHNAVKYSFRPPTGSQGARRYIKVWGQWLNSEQEYYQINVQNYGVGISQTEIDNRLILRIYYRGINANDKRRTGAGFGLAHAKQVVEDMHHGKINVTSVKQGGEGYLTTFTITLPVEHAK